MTQIIAQLIVSLSVLWVWLMRPEPVIAEFERFGLSDQTRAAVGTAKIALSFSMLYSIWVPEITFVPAAGLALLMGAAQYFHMQFDSPMQKRIPSFVLLLLCVYIVAEHR